MGELVAHRGPDSVGYLRQPTIQMGTRRLKIIDLDGGDQPIPNEDETIWVCQNGEIYNYVELREELTNRGHQFRTEADTEVIAHAYEQWGPDFVEHLNGMFAIAVWDQTKRRLLLTRDRCGQKPLYYWKHGSRLVFASEIKALLECSEVPREVSRSSIDSYLMLRYVPEPTTMLDDIQTLAAGHTLVWDTTSGGNQSEPKRWWSVPEGGGSPLVDPEEQLEKTFNDAVRISLRSDVPVGAYLSGGVDSSLLVAAMREHQDDIHTFSIGFGTKTDETALAAKTAARLDTHHHEVLCSPDDVAELLPKVVYHMDRPVGDSLTVAFYKLAAAAREEVKVVLSGEGADEMFAGYPFHRAMMSIERLRGRYSEKTVHERLPGIVNRIPVGLLNQLNAFPAYLGKSGRKRVTDYLRSYPELDLWHKTIGLRTLFGEDERRQLYASGFNSAFLIDRGRHLYEESGHKHFLDRVLALQWKEWLQDWALIRQDKNAMAHGLEVRLPFLDHRLIKLAFQLPPERKMAGKRDKIALRELAAKRLPAATAKRKKIPFHLPIEHFLENPGIVELIRDNLSPDRVKARGHFDSAAVLNLVSRMGNRDFVAAKQVMALVILELWERQFVDRERLS